MKILVTGADGFIGSHLTEALVRAGYDVRAFVCYNSFNSWGWLDHCGADVRGRFDVFAGDIRDPYGVRTAMRGCEKVLHLAALIAIQQNDIKRILAYSTLSQLGYMVMAVGLSGRLAAI
jgi:dTDP-glucose 4,6-dehydratase